MYMYIICVCTSEIISYIRQPIPELERARLRFLSTETFQACGLQMAISATHHSTILQNVISLYCKVQVP